MEFLFLFFLITVAIAIAVAIADSYLFVQGCRRRIDRLCRLAAFTVFVCPSFCCRRLWCKNFCNKHEASPESGNCQIHASLSHRLVLLLSIAIIARF